MGTSSLRSKTCCTPPGAIAFTLLTRGHADRLDHLDLVGFRPTPAFHRSDLRVVCDSSPSVEGAEPQRFSSDKRGNRMLFSLCTCWCMSCSKVAGPSSIARRCYAHRAAAPPVRLGACLSIAALSCSVLHHPDRVGKRAALKRHTAPENHRVPGSSGTAHALP